MKRQLLRTIMVMIMASFIMPLSSFAYDQYESMNVGETKTFYFPSEVTNRASMMYAYNCSSDHIINVEVISYTNTSVTVKALEYTQSQVHISFDYWWIENGRERHDTHVVHIDLNDGGGGGGNTDSDYNPSNYDNDYGSWGTITVEVGKTTTAYCQQNFPNPSKVKSILWSDYNQFGYEITSQNSSSCTIKGHYASSGCVLWCLMKYGNTSYKAYYTVVVKESTTPTLSLSANPAGGIIDEGTKVYLTASYSSADIYYTLNGSQPTTSSSRYTSSGITINETCTLKAFARKSGYNDSPIMTWIFTIDEENQTKILIDATNFPDEIFRNYLLEQDYGKDGVLTKSEISAVTELKVRDMNIGSLIGIELFTELKKLDCYKNKITSLDVSKNTKLSSLVCSSNPLSSLDVSQNPDLTDLSCSNNQLTSLDVSKNSRLKDLNCNYNSLSSLDVSKNLELSRIQCNSNQLTSLDFSNNSKLVFLICDRNHLNSLDVSNNIKLETLYCGWNSLSSLDLLNNIVLRDLTCEYNHLSSLDVSRCTKLRYLVFYKNDISGEEMDALINGLSENTDNYIHEFEVFRSGPSPYYGYFDNFCTNAQITAVKAKGWTPEDAGNEITEVIEVSNVLLNKNTLTLQEGQEERLIETVLPDNAQVKSVKWSSSDESVARVNQIGWVFAKSVGTATIKCMAIGGIGISNTCELKVEPDLSGISNVTIDGQADTSVFSISGQRLSAPKKGINIVGGKKIIVK